MTKPPVPVKVPGKANPQMLPPTPTTMARVCELLVLPTSVWLPPMMLIFCTSSEDTPPLQVALTMAGVYLLIAGANHVIIGPPKLDAESKSKKVR